MILLTIQCYAIKVIQKRNNWWKFILIIIHSSSGSSLDKAKRESHRNSTGLLCTAHRKETLYLPCNYLSFVNSNKGIGWWKGNLIKFKLVLPHISTLKSQRLLFKHCQFNVSANVKVFPPLVYKTEMIAS